MNFKKSRDPVKWLVGVANYHLTTTSKLTLHSSLWRVELCCCGCLKSIVNTEASFWILIKATVRTSVMSSLLKPFLACEGSCESYGVRRCPSSAAPRQPPTRRLGGLPAQHLSYSAKRNLAAAAVGGRKVTHPGKAILAGRFLLSIWPSLYIDLNSVCVSSTESKPAITFMMWL